MGLIIISTIYVANAYLFNLITYQWIAIDYIYNIYCFYNVPGTKYISHT